VVSTIKSWISTYVNKTFLKIHYTSEIIKYFGAENVKAEILKQ